MRSFLPRLQIFRAVAPRVAAPLLPTSRLRLATSALTNSPRPANLRLFNHFPSRLNSIPPSPRSPQEDPRATLPPNASLSQKLKLLIKSYGWYALGVYLVLSALDFGVAFVGINLLGAEYVSQVASAAKAMVAQVLPSRPAEPGLDEIDSIHNGQAKGGQEGLYAMLVLAYTIHKTLFLPVRVGLTAAFTPRLVGWLRQRGWAGSAGTRRAANEMRDKIKERRNRSSDE
ncbi:hypothetical protein B0H34DRAFT_746547 [Crassisporium funariophilum]|nr:hypothetical protein B0H34DRAFT_746547 [Crassisporium funariophilum]